MQYYSACFDDDKHEVYATQHNLQHAYYSQNRTSWKYELSLLFFGIDDVSCGLAATGGTERW